MIFFITIYPHIDIILFCLNFDCFGILGKIETKFGWNERVINIIIKIVEVCFYFIYTGLSNTCLVDLNEKVSNNSDHFEFKFGRSFS